MASLTSQLTQLFGDAFAALGLDPDHGVVVISQRPELAQFQCNGALGAAKSAGKNPRELAQDVIDIVSTNEALEELSIAGPGFINIRLDDDYVAKATSAIATADRLGVEPPETPVNVLVDYGGPNVAKALHVGHLRPAIIGESVKRLFAYAGHPTVGDIHVGDWGTPMGQIIALIRERHPELPFFDPEFAGPYPDEIPFTEADLEAIYPIAAALAKEDESFAAEAQAANLALQQGAPGYLALLDRIRAISLADMKRTYDDLNVDFELWYGEARVHRRIPELIDRMREAGAVTESQGALVVDVREPGDKNEIPPLLLTRSDGSFMYSTTDLATIDERVDDLGIEAIFYVVDDRQSLHFEQLFRAARRGGIVSDDVLLEHDPFGTVNGPDGKPMRTREGDLPPLRGLIRDAWARAAERLEESDLATEYPAEERDRIVKQVGTAALKYGDLQNHRTSDYIFDLDRFVSFVGKTGPYLLYSAVRIRSILRIAAEQGLEPGELVAPDRDAERNLMLQLVRFPDVIARAIEFRAPNHLAEFAYDVATEFNRFYEACHILSETDAGRQASWLRLVDVTLRVLLTLLDLLAIEVPERM
ncbi:MAG TPA: arginine--tRNA ligase [Acidimicrobiia bacterium]|jgi:arginyl-tRNA synthetase|nr:arginine--tRNA ligase [Acidimicrobiia bacterium]